MRRCTALAVFLIGAVACQPAPKNLVVILIDTLRADHLGAYGHPRVQTPHIDSLALESVVFEKAFTVVPTTLASTASIFTGHYPRTLGLPRNHFVLSDSAVTLAETLSRAGYSTAAFVAAMPLSSRTKISQGFEFYHEGFKKVGERLIPQRRGEKVTDSVLSWLGRRDSRPYFLFVHYFDVHFPYDPPPPYDSLYTAPDPPEIDGTLDSLKKLRDDLQGGLGRAAEIAHVRSLYLGEITYVDREIGRLLEAIHRDGSLDQTLLILMADHGETFEEHELDYFNHGRMVYDTTLHIPLIFRLPHGQFSGRRVKEMVRTIDIAPTIYELLDISSAPEMEGVSFAPLLRGESAETERTVFAEATMPYDVEPKFGWPNEKKAKCVRTDRWKYVWIPYLQDREELYDLASDPGEYADLLTSVDGSPDTATVKRQLRTAMNRLIDRASGTRSKYVDEETREALRALGYVE